MTTGKKKSREPLGGKEDESPLIADIYDWLYCCLPAKRYGDLKIFQLPAI
jgi:hypothetical protein